MKRHRGIQAKLCHPDLLAEIEAIAMFKKQPAQPGQCWMVRLPSRHLPGLGPRNT
jgi:hypothetical protein